MPDAVARFPIDTIQPGAYSVQDVSALQDGGSSQAPVVAVIGQSTGGAPNSALYFTRQQTLKAVLRSGAAFDCARLALIAGAQRVAVVRAGSGILPASSVLAGASGTPITLTARDSGAWTNAIKRTVAANNSVTLSFTDANGVTFTETFNCGASATLQDVADTINGVKPNVAGSAYVTATVGTGTLPLATSAQANLAGGSDGTLNAGDWTNALAVLETEDVSIVCAATGDATVHAQVLTHCNAMSATIARKERTAVFGAVAGESVSQQVTRVSGMRDRRAQLIYPGITQYDASGNLTAYAPFYAAAFMAGKHVALPDAATSATHLALPEVVDVEAKLSYIPGGAIDQLLAAGVSPIAAVPGGGFWLVDSLTGWQTDGYWRDFHKTRTADVAAQRLRARLEDKFVGGKGLDGTADAIKREAIDELRDQTTEELLRGYRDPDVVQSGTNPTRYQVTCPVMLPETTKFIQLVIALQPPGTLAAGVSSS